MVAAKSSRKAHQLVKRRLFHAREYWRNDNFAIGRNMAFALFLEHYKHDHPDTKDKTRVQPKTLRQFNLARHKASLLLRQMTEFDTHAAHGGVSEVAAEVSFRVISQIFNDPLKCYHDVRSRMVWSMLSAGRGDVAIDWHPKWGVCFRFVDPRRLHITPGFTFLHDPRNPCTIEEFPMRLSEVKSMGWNVPSDLSGDGGSPLSLDTSGRDADGIERDSSSYLPGVDENDDSDPLVTVCKAWFRDDPFGNDNKKLANADLPESDWHHHDDATGQKVPFDPSNPTPPMSPATGQPMRFVTSQAEMNTGHEYDDGYLIITAPMYAGENGTLFEGKWTEGALDPTATLCAYPYMELTAYKHPLRREGINDTMLTKALVVIDDATQRAAFEQIRLTTGLLITKPGGLKDSQGNQYQFKNLPMDIAYADDMLTQESVKFFQAPGMNPAMPQFWGKVSEEWQNIGTGDFSASLGPERSKDIAVGTATMLQQTGDLPVQLHQQDLNLQEAIGARVVLDWCRAYMGDNVVSWVTDQGDAMYANVRGSDLAPLNVTIRADKQWSQETTDKVQAQAQLIGMLGKSGLPPEVVLALLKDSGASAEVQSAMNKSLNAPPSGPDPQMVTAQAAMISAVAKAGLPPAALGAMLKDAGVDDQLIQAVMQAIGGQQGPPANAPPPSPGGRPNLQMIQGGSPQ